MPRYLLEWKHFKGQKDDLFRVRVCAWYILLSEYTVPLTLDKLFFVDPSWSHSAASS